MHIHSFLRQSDLKLFLQQAPYCLALGFSHQLLLKRYGKLPREMSWVIMFALSPEHLSILQASKCLSLLHLCGGGKCCNAIWEEGNWGRGMMHFFWGWTLLHIVTPASSAARLEYTTLSIQPWGFLPTKAKKLICFNSCLSIGLGCDQHERLSRSPSVIPCLPVYT